MDFFKKMAFKYVVPLVSILSVSTTSLEAQAYGGSNNCCEISWCDILVPLAIGAAAGAATAAAINHKGKHGRRGAVGPQGPEGEDPFVRDVGSSLTFNFSLTLDASLVPVGTANIIPFISQPDGTVITGTPFNGTLTTAQTTSITIANPPFGTYNFGYEIPAHTGTAVATIANSVDATRVGNVTATTVYNSTSNIAASASAELQLPPDQFIYGSLGQIP